MELYSAFFGTDSMYLVMSFLGISVTTYSTEIIF